MSQDDRRPTDEPIVFPLEGLAERIARGRRDFCKTAGVGLVALGLPGCFGESGSARVGTGSLDDDAGIPGAVGGGSHDMARGSTAPVDMAAPGGGPVDMAQGSTGPVDMAHAGPVDLKMSTPHDLAVPPASSCPSGVTSTGKAPSSFGMNTATFFSSQEVFICRDGGGLYAMSSICPHAGCDVTFRSTGTYFHCPCHSATFDYDGNPTGGPVSSGLDHFAICVDGSGHVAFDPNKLVSQSSRLVA